MLMVTVGILFKGPCANKESEMGGSLRPNMLNIGEKD